MIEINPFHFFHHDHPFPFNLSTPYSPFQEEYFQNIRQMVKHYQSILNEDFWKNVSTMGQHQDRTNLPIEIWENDDFIFLTVITPGLKNLDRVEERFLNDQLITLKLYLPAVKPDSANVLIKSELPKGEYERDIFLPKAVETMDYSVSLESGILTYVFKKAREMSL